MTGKHKILAINLIAGPAPENTRLFHWLAYGENTPWQAIAFSAEVNRL